MDSLTIKAPVTVKAKLTEKLKKRLIDERNQAIESVKLEFAQLENDENRALAEQAHGDLQRVQEIRQFFNMERQKRLAFKVETEKSITEIESLSLGAEIVQGTLERITEAKIGDNLRSLMNVEILAEDDVIIAIRD